MAQDNDVRARSPLLLAALATTWPTQIYLAIFREIQTVFKLANKNNYKLECG